MRPKLSVAIGPNFGIRIFSTPLLFNFTCTVVSLAATRNDSIARLGYNFPSTVVIKGMRLLTPSTSGNVLTVPTPAAEFSSTGMLAINPGY